MQGAGVLVRFGFLLRPGAWWWTVVLYTMQPMAGGCFATCKEQVRFFARMQLCVAGYRQRDVAYGRRGRGDVQRAGGLLATVKLSF